MTTIFDLEDLQPTIVLPLDRAVHRFGRTYLQCPAHDCTRISGHYGPCDKHRGRHRPNRVAAVVGLSLAAILLSMGCAGGLGHPVKHPAPKTSHSVPGGEAKTRPVLSGPKPVIPAKKPCPTPAPKTTPPSLVKTAPTPAPPVVVPVVATPAPATGNVGAPLTIAKPVAVAAPALANTGADTGRLLAVAGAFFAAGLGLLGAARKVSAR